jgi:hypothetical protein
MTEICDSPYFGLHTPEGLLDTWYMWITPLLLLSFLPLGHNHHVKHISILLANFYISIWSSIEDVDWFVQLFSYSILPVLIAGFVLHVLLHVTSGGTVHSIELCTTSGIFLTTLLLQRHIEKEALRFSFFFFGIIIYGNTMLLLGGSGTSTNDDKIGFLNTFHSFTFQNQVLPLVYAISLIFVYLFPCTFPDIVFIIIMTIFPILQGFSRLLFGKYSHYLGKIVIYKVQHDMDDRIVNEHIPAGIFSLVVTIHSSRSLLRNFVRSWTLTIHPDNSVTEEYTSFLIGRKHKLGQGQIVYDKGDCTIIVGDRHLHVTRTHLVGSEYLYKINEVSTATNKVTRLCMCDSALFKYLDSGKGNCNGRLPNY